MTSSTLRSANLKVQRAAKHIDELRELLAEKQPFTYMLETVIPDNSRATYARRNEFVIEEAMVIVGEILYDLRSALDHAYWAVVSPFAVGAGQERAIQFPFTETKDKLVETIKNRLAHKVSNKFSDFILSLKPHGEPGGNDLLYLLHTENGVDKHRTLIPVGDYTRLSSDNIRTQVPDFPRGMYNCSFGTAFRDIRWPIPPAVRAALLEQDCLTPIFEQQLDVPVQVTFSSLHSGPPRPLVPTLLKLREATMDVITRMDAFV